MEIDMKDELAVTVERLAAAAGLLEQAVERLAQKCRGNHRPHCGNRRSAP
jgi:hypothetical protein